ncbi:ras GEF, partial [Fistulina hepatica ATCC 64428]
RPLRPGELPLPSRTPTISTSSTTSIPIMPTPSPGRLQTSTSLQSIPCKSVAPLDNAGRARSGSVGVTPRDTSQWAITLLVIGAHGCGKSTAVRKCFRYGLSDPVPFVPASVLPGANAKSKCYKRSGPIVGEDGVTVALTVIEANIAAEEFVPYTPIAAAVSPNPLRVDGAVMCYDSSDARSYAPIEGLTRYYHSIRLPAITLACKSDLPQDVHPEEASRFLRSYEIGLIEVSNNDIRKSKIRRTFIFLVKVILRQQRRQSIGHDFVYHNPAWDPWDTALTSVPSDTFHHANTEGQLSPKRAQTQGPAFPSPLSATPIVPRSPNSPTRTRSTAGDADHDSDGHGAPTTVPSMSSPLMKMKNSSSCSLPGGVSASSGTDHTPPPPLPPNIMREKKEQQRPTQWATVDELLDNLLFAAIIDDDPKFITHFLLTYRRFATPRTVLLSMQKRMRQLDQDDGDPVFSAYAQMRICNLLEMWIHDYPGDFAVRGTSGALSALAKSIISKTYLLHYGSDLMPFLEILPTIRDKDADWSSSDDDDGYDEDEDVMKMLISASAPPIHLSDESDPSSDEEAPPPPRAAPLRERTGSLPLARTTIATAMHDATTEAGSRNSHPGTIKDKVVLPISLTHKSAIVPRQTIKELQRISQEINYIDSLEIAQEITRIGVRAFMDIEPRHWLKYTFVSGRKDPRTDTIARFNEISNRLADWVVSLILCHDRAKARAKQIEKLVDIAQKLRTLNNYSALRAFVAGINNSTFPGDQTLEQFKTKSPDQAKSLQSWDVLLQHIRSHRAYRLALRNTTGPCIPALEVHMSDLIRAHEGNSDVNATDEAKIHWGKFTMMGRFISETTQFRSTCQLSSEYIFPRREHIESLLNTPYLMNVEMQKSRIAPPDTGFDDFGSVVRDHSGPKDVARLRKLFFW